MYSMHSVNDIPKSHLENILELYITSITFTLSLQFILLIYRKLKSKNITNKNNEENQHQLQKNLIMATIARRSNPIMRFIGSLTGSCYAGNDKYERSPSKVDAGSQVCDEIISKREKRNKVSQDAEGDHTPREGFIQEMFDSSSSSFSSSSSSSSSSSCCGATQAADPKIQETHTCSVCLDELSLGNENTTKTGCGHTFHLSCLLKSLTQKNTCPMCRGDLEDVRTKQMPANILTPVSAEQIIEEEISYFATASHTHSITLTSATRARVNRAKEMLRVFGLTLLQTVSEYVHGENMPQGWYDDGNSESESDTEEEEDNNEDDQDADDQDADDEDNEDEFNYAYANRVSIRGDLRDSIGS